MRNFKPGDLALITKCTSAPQLVGKCVELLEYAAPGQEIEACGYGWLSSRPSWIVSGDSLVRRTVDGKLHNSPIAMFSESSLMPLRGDFAPEQQKSREVVA